MRSPPLRLALLLVLILPCGCQAPRPATATPGHAGSAQSGKKSFDVPTRNNSLALLADLLNDEKNVSLILIIKRESSELNRLVKDISEAAGHGAKLLESMARQNPGLQLSETGLPPGEQATREAIAKTKKHLLLHSKGAEFEFQLLLTQAQALGYGAHLAQVAAENEPQPARAREFSNLSAQLQQLYEQVLAMLRKKG